MLKHLNTTSFDHDSLAELYHDRKCVSAIVFCKHLSEHLYNDNQHMVKHNKLLVSRITEEAINKLNTKWFTQDYILTELFPKYNIISDRFQFEPTCCTVELQSEITEEAHKNLKTKWFTTDEVRKLMLKYEIQPWKTSDCDLQENNEFLKTVFHEIDQMQVKIIEFQLWEKHKNEDILSYVLPRTVKQQCEIQTTCNVEKENEQFKNNLVDKVYHTQVKLLEFELLENYKRTAKYKVDQETGEYVEDENGELIELSEDEWLQAWDALILELTMPRTIIEYKRKYNYMPEPYCHWDYRNFWQQYFFIEDGNDNLYACGGTGSSSQREINGLMTHTFATLTKQYNKQIPTLIYEYNEHNEFILINSYESFKTLPHELNGNYRNERINHETIKELFQDLLINYNRTDNDYSIHDYRFT